jgi:hypothetical protein
MLTANIGIESINATDYNRAPKSKLILVMCGGHILILIPRAYTIYHATEQFIIFPS